MEIPFLHPRSTETSGDALAERLRGAARWILIAACGLLPILFVPSAYMPLSTGKTVILGAAVFLAILAFMLSLLREGSLSVRLTMPVLGLWIIAIVTVVSAAFSGDIRDAFFGDGLDGYTAAFTLLVAVTATVMGVFGKSQIAIMRLYVALVGSALLLSAFHAARLIFGPETLAFGLWNNSTASPIGSWNGLAVFFGLIVILSLIALLQLPLTQIGRYISGAVIAVSLAMLVVINFSSVWWVLTFVAGSIALYHLAKNLWKQNGSPTTSSEQDPWSSLIVSLAVLLVSIVMIIGGARLSNAIADKAGVSFVEVRPSALATLDLGQAALKDDALLGAGPNHFVDVWRVYKDPAINQTIFWNVPFDSGYSYVMTSIIGTGIIGALAWTLFLVGLLWSGYRFLFMQTGGDRFWYFIGLSSFVSSLYFWGIALIYMPPPPVILLASITTGVFAVAYSRLQPGRSYTISVAKNRNYGFVLIAITVIVITASSYGVYSAGAQVLGTYEFNKALGSVKPGDSLDQIEANIASAFDLSRNDAFARQIAFYRWSEMTSLLSLQNASQQDQQRFQNAASLGIQAASLAISLDPTDPYNHQILGQIYGVLAIVGVEGAKDKALESLQNAAKTDPQNPVLPFLRAELAAGTGDAAGSRSAAEDAVRLKSNYTEALFYLAQLDINEGNLDRALSIVGGIVQLEPQNPARRYQLGVLLASAKRLDESILAFEQAVTLDPQYANARYFLALGYAEKGRVEDAIQQLTMVRDLNPDNSGVDNMIEQLRTNGKLQAPDSEQSPVTERDGSDKVTDKDLENGLVTSSNPVPEGDNSETEDSSDAVAGGEQ